MNSLERLLARADAEQKKRLAAHAKTSVNHLYQLASGHRGAGPDLARRIEHASVKMSNERLPVVLREDLCDACKTCEFAKACRSKR